MKIKLSVLLFTVLFSTQLLAQALPSAPFVVVRGHAEREMRPDRYEINITVQKTSMDLNEVSQTVEPMAMYKARADMAAAPPLGGTMEDGVVMVSKDVYVVYLIAADK